LKRTLIIFILIILIIPFQNCLQQGISQVDQTSLKSSDGSTSTNNSSNGGSTVGGGTGGTTTMSLLETQTRCLALIGKPTITSLSNTAFSLYSGFGSTSQGDTTSTLDMNISMSISNQSEYDRLGCNSVVNNVVSCTLDVASAYSITSAMDMKGDDLIKAGKTQANLAGSAFANRNSCSMTFGKGLNTIKLSIKPNSFMNNDVADPVRCVEGNFSIALSVRSEVALDNPPAGVSTSFKSDSKSVAVVMKNGCWKESRLRDLKETTTNISDFGSFGTAVQISGTTAVVLAPNDDSSGSIINVGSAYIYELESGIWKFKQKISNTDSNSNESFSSVAILADTLVITSALADSQGAAYFYRRTASGWTLIKRFGPDYAQTYQQFGYSVAISDRYLAIGAPKLSYNSVSGRGAVYIYSYNESGVQLVSTLYGELANSGFGSSISMDSTYLAIGAPQNIGKESQAEGSVYVYAQSDLLLKAQKKGSTVAERFGDSVSILGTKLVVGSPNSSSSNKTANGKASYFENFMTTTAAKTWAGTVDKENFGQSVAMNSKGLFIGSPFSTANTYTRAGFVNFYKFASLTNPSFILTAYNSTKDSAFGCAVAVTEDYAIVGARIKTSDLGEAYIYRYQ